MDAYQKMAWLPKGASLLDPTEACGFYLYSGNKPVFFLPGVPREVRLLAESRVLPILLSQDKDQQAVRQRVFKLFGPQEAKIGEVLDGVTNAKAMPWWDFYPNFPENHVTVTVRDVSAERAEERLSRIEHEVDRRLGDFMVAKDNATLEETVGELLRARGWHLAVAESCTGGLISQRITSVSGSSDYFDRGMVVYSNQAKHELLGVSWDTLNQHGAVSHETAEAMAVGARKTAGRYCSGHHRHCRSHGRNGRKTRGHGVCCPVHQRRREIEAVSVLRTKIGNHGPDGSSGPKLAQAVHDR